VALVEVSDSPDIVVLRTARGGRLLPAMRVVIGGVASRHDLPFDQLDDTQLAVETLLAEESLEGGGELVLTVSSSGGAFMVRLDGLHNQSVKAALLATELFRPCEGCLLDVRMLLDSLVDGYRVQETTAGSFAVEMEKRTP
jgi:hypothetical protein